MVDFHTHILSGIDDGSSDIETSVKMLETLYAHGVDRVVLTPHFYMTRDNIEDFLKHRREAVDALSLAVQNRNDIPKAALGAEVLLFPELCRMDGVERLCIEGTNYMLVEMPFSEWSRVTYDALVNLRANGILPIIAHVERYMKIQKDRSMIFQLLDLGCLIQTNGSFFTSFSTKRKAKKMLLGDVIHCLGSDCHDLIKRKPNVYEAYSEIERKVGSEYIDNLKYIADTVLENAIYCL